MRPKTAIEVQDDVFDLVRASPLREAISGTVYHKGQRERNRKKWEDIIVIHTTSDPSQKQVGVVTLNIYVPDHDPTGTGQMIEHRDRIRELSTIAADWVCDLNLYRETDYTFELYNEITTIEDQDTEAHIVVVKLEYTIFNI